MVVRRESVPGWVCEIMKRTRYRNVGSTVLQLAYVAKGSMVATIAETPKLWDIAAGAIIAESAGAVVSNWLGEKIFPIEPENYEGDTFQILAANQKIHSEIVGMLNS